MRECIGWRGSVLQCCGGEVVKEGAFINELTNEGILKWHTKGLRTKGPRSPRAKSPGGGWVP